MRDANGNELAGAVSLKGANGRPVAERVLTAVEEGTVRTLRSVQAELEQLRERFAGLAREHEESLKTSEQIAEAYTELKAKQAQESEPFPLEAA